MNRIPTGFERCTNEEIMDFVLGNRGDPDMPKAMDEFQRRGYTGKVSFKTSVEFYRKLHDDDVGALHGAFKRKTLFQSGPHDWADHLLIEDAVWVSDRGYADQFLHLLYMVQRVDDPKFECIRAFITAKIDPSLGSRRRWLHEGGSIMNENDIPKELIQTYQRQRDTFLRVCAKYQF